MKNKIRLLKKRLRKGRNNDLKLKMVPWQSPEYFAAIKLRNDSLNRPSGLSLITSPPDQEEHAMHIVATIKGEVVGTLFLDGTERDYVAQIKQVAVSSEHRGRKIGQHLMTYAENIAIQHSYQEIVLYARESAWQFYEKLHYVNFGEQASNGANLMQYYRKELGISSDSVEVA